MPYQLYDMTVCLLRIEIGRILAIIDKYKHTQLNNEKQQLHEIYNSLENMDILDLAPRDAIDRVMHIAKVI